MNWGVCVCACTHKRMSWGWGDQCWIDRPGGGISQLDCGSMGPGKASIHCQCSSFLSPGALPGNFSGLGKVYSHLPPPSPRSYYTHPCYCWGTEAQRDYVPCPKAHRKPIAAQGIEPRSPESQLSPLTKDPSILPCNGWLAV